jgi:hypothetical protein
MYLASRRRDPVSFMLASVIYIGALQMIFYNMFAGSLPIILIAIGLLFRPDVIRISQHQATERRTREFDSVADERTPTQDCTRATPAGSVVQYRRRP